MCSGLQGDETSRDPFKCLLHRFRRPARFCSYSKPRSTVSKTSKWADSAASRSSPFLRPAKPAYSADSHSCQEGNFAVSDSHTRRAEPTFMICRTEVVELLPGRRWPSRGSRWEIL